MTPPPPVDSAEAMRNEPCPVSLIAPSHGQQNRSSPSHEPNNEPGDEPADEPGSRGSWFVAREPRAGPGSCGSRLASPGEPGSSGGGEPGAEAVREPGIQTFARKRATIAGSESQASQVSGSMVRRVRRGARMQT